MHVFQVRIECILSTCAVPYVSSNSAKFLKISVISHSYVRTVVTSKCVIWVLFFIIRTIESFHIVKSTAKNSFSKVEVKPSELGIGASIRHIRLKKIDEFSVQILPRKYLCNEKQSTSEDNENCLQNLDLILTSCYCYCASLHILTTLSLCVLTVLWHLLLSAERSQQLRPRL
jgi:hypothetical protein